MAVVNANCLCGRNIQIEVHELPGHISVNQRQWIRFERRVKRGWMDFIWGETSDTEWRPSFQEDIFDLRYLFGEKKVEEEDKRRRSGGNQFQT